MEMKIGILSDTHDLLRPEVKQALRGCGCILHAGDITRPEVLRRLKETAPVKAVRGNCDGAWAADLPTALETEIAGLRIFMTHRRKDLPADLSGYDLAVFGHSHRYCSEWTGTGRHRTLLLNPGSCGPARFRLPVTLAVLSVGADGFIAKRIDLGPGGGEKTAAGDLRRQIEDVVRETQKGRTVDEICRRLGTEREMTEQIVRLYVTHPGVSADGIMTKMGL